MRTTKIHEGLTKTKEKHTVNFRMIRPTEQNFSAPIINTTKLGLFKLSSYSSLLNVNRRNNHFLYSSTVIEDYSPIRETASPIAEPLSPNTNTVTNTSTNTNANVNTKTNRERTKSPSMAESLISSTNTDSNITSVLNYNNEGILLLYLTITPGAYKLTDIAEKK